MAGSRRWPGSNVVALRFSDEQLRALKALARRARVPVATLCRRLVLDELAISALERPLVAAVDARVDTGRNREAVPA